MRNPDGTVSRLSEFCGIPYPTFISIKGRLRSKNAYYKLNLPSIWDLGGDIISFDLVFSPMIGMNGWKGSEILRGYPYQVLENSDMNTMISVSVSPDYKNLLGWRARIINELSRSGFPFSHEHMEFPCSGLRLYSFFDFTSILEGELNLECSDIKGAPAFSRSNPDVEISPTFHEVLRAMLHRPHLNNRELAEYLGLSRQTINRFSRSAREENLLHPVILPDVEILGYGIMGVFLIDLRGFDTEGILERLAGADDELRSRRFMNIYSTGKQVIFTTHRDFDDYQRTRIHLEEIYDRFGFEGVEPLAAPIVLGIGERSPFFYLERMANMI